MKKFLGVLFLASGLLSFTACSGEESDGPESDVIWDIAPFVIHITVSDKDGNDLLNPETSQSIAIRKGFHICPRWSVSGCSCCFQRLVCQSMA